MSSPSINLSRDRRIPIYEQIYSFLKERIISGEYKPGQRLSGIKVMAKSLGVNHITLRQALKKLKDDGLLITESTRGTFVAGKNASQLQIALLLPNLNESSSKISAGVQGFLAQSRSTVDIFHFDENPELECEYLARLSAEGYDGAIVFPSLDSRSLKPLLEMILSGFPLVFIDRAPGQLPCWSVWSDNFHGGYLATEHLIDRGCTRIACAATGLGGVSERYDGYLKAMGDRKLPIDYSIVHKFDQNDAPIEETVEAWLSLATPLHGIVFSNDFQALRGLRTVSQHGLSVPKDVRITGFDDLSICTYSSPQLTTIRQNYSGIGLSAAELLQAQINVPKQQRFCRRHESIPVELIVREST
jgi:DNA-binding LacI/PurR family transcriptional regulator